MIYVSIKAHSIRLSLKASTSSASLYNLHAGPTATTKTRATLSRSLNSWTLTYVLFNQIARHIFDYADLYHQRSSASTPSRHSETLYFILFFILAACYQESLSPSGPASHARRGSRFAAPCGGCRDCTDASLLATWSICRRFRRAFGVFGP